MRTNIAAGMFGILALASLAPAAYAEDEAGPFSAGVALTSDCRSRSSQTDRAAAVQAGSSGLFRLLRQHLGVEHHSTIRQAARRTTQRRVDFTLGYNHSFSESTSAIKAACTIGRHARPPRAVRLLRGHRERGTRRRLRRVLSRVRSRLFRRNRRSLFAGAASAFRGREFSYGRPRGVEQRRYQWIDDNTAFGTPTMSISISAPRRNGRSSPGVRWVDTGWKQRLHTVDRNFATAALC
jgi:hypothetical protein